MGFWPREPNQGSKVVWDFIYRRIAKFKFSINGGYFIWKLFNKLRGIMPGLVYFYFHYYPRLFLVSCQRLIICQIPNPEPYPSISEPKFNAAVINNN